VQSKTLSLVKSASPSTYSTVGQVISYSYLVQNTGNVTMTAVGVADDKASVTCPAVTLAAGASMTCTANYTIKQADLDAGSVVNTAKSSGTPPQGPGINLFPYTTLFRSVQSKTLSLVKSASPSTYSTVGQVISYSYVVQN